MVKTIVLFGGTARKKQGTNDIDVLVVLDDVSMMLTPELVQTYRIIVGKIIAKVSNRLHITTLKLSAFWEYVRVGDPVAVNILRDGFPLLDSGFFDPMQQLLHQGRIRPSPESIWTYMTRAENTLSNSRWHLMQATVDLYWAVVDAAHAALMRIGEIPPSPEHVPEMLEDRMVKANMIPRDYPNKMRKFYQLMKDITNRKRQGITGPEFEKLAAEAEEFVKTMRSIVEK